MNMILEKRYVNDKKTVNKEINYFIQKKKTAKSIKQLSNTVLTTKNLTYINILLSPTLSPKDIFSYLLI